MLPECAFECSSYINGRSCSLLLRSTDDALVELHNRLSSAFFCRQFEQCFSNFICDILHHVDFVFGPGTAIIALLQDHNTMGAHRAAQGNTEERLCSNQLQFFLCWRDIRVLLTFK